MEFNLSKKDLAVVEVLFAVAKKDISTGFDEVHTELKKVNVEVEAIRVPLDVVGKKTTEVADNIQATLKFWEGLIADKKAEILKSEEDFSEYEAAFAQARADVAENLQEATIAGAKRTNKMRV